MIRTWLKRRFALLSEVLGFTYDISKLDQLEHETSQNLYNACLRIDDNHIFVVYRGFDHWAKVFNITNDGLITQLSVVAHEPNEGNWNKLLRIDNEHYALVYARLINADLMFKVFNINPTTYAVTEISKTQLTTGEARISGFEKIDETHFIVSYTSAAPNYGRVATIEIDGSYIPTIKDDYVYETSFGGGGGSVALIDSTHFALAHTGNSSDGFIKTFSFDLVNYLITQVYNLEHDTGRGAYESLVLLDSTHLVLAYMGNANDGYIVTFEIDGSYNLSELNILEHDIIYGIYNDLIVLDAEHVALAYTGEGGDGYLKTFNINPTTYEPTQLYELEHDIVTGAYNSLALLSNDGNVIRLALAYLSGGSDGQISSFLIENILPLPDTATNWLDGLVASWQFEDNFRDYTGNHPATSFAGTTYELGKIGKGGSFDGINDYLEVADSDDFSFTNDDITDIAGSIAFWVRFDVDQRAMIISKRPNFEWQIQYNDSTSLVDFTLYSNGASSSFLTSKSTFNPIIGQWYHLVFTYAGGNTATGLKIYLDGVDTLATTSESGTYVAQQNTTAIVRIGKQDNNTKYHNGALDEIKFYRNRELTASEVLEMYTTELTGVSVLPNKWLDSLVASWQFQDNFEDYLGNHLAVKTGTVDFVDGQVNRCADFQGTSDYLEVTDHADFQFTDGAGNDIAFTMSFWVKLDTLAGNPTLISKLVDVGGVDREWLVDRRSSANQIRVLLWSGLTDQLELNINWTPVISTWYHVVITYDGSKNGTGLAGYINGVDATASVGTTYSGMLVGSSNVFLGTRAWSPSVEELNGKLDEVKIWKGRELSANDVIELHTLELAGKDVFAEIPINNLVLYQRFDNDVTDETGNHTPVPIGLTYGNGVYSGNANEAVVFNAGTDKLYIPNSSLFDFGSNAWSFSVCLNLSGSQIGDVGWLLNKNIGASYNAFASWIAGVNKNINFAMWSGGAGTDRIRLTGQSNISTGVPFTVIVTIDGSNTYGGVKIYLNNNLEICTDNSAGVYTGMDGNTDPLYIGSTPDTDAQGYIGNKDGLALWNKELNEAERTAIHNKYVSGLELL